MSDPITGAIAGSVANAAIEKIVKYINESEDPEAAWKRSGLEVAIQAEAFYRQEIVAGRTYSPDKIERELNKYGEISQQLAIRGEIRGFDDVFIKLFRSFGDALGKFADASGGIGADPTEPWEEIVEKYLDRIKKIPMYDT